MWLTRSFNYIAFKPMDAIGFILAFLLFCTGAWLLGPFFSAEAATSSLITGSLLLLPKALGAIQFLTGGARNVALFNKEKSWSIKVRRTCAMIMFILYIFYGISGAFLYGLTTPRWYSTIAIALMAAVKYLYLGVVGDRDHGD